MEQTAPSLNDALRLVSQPHTDTSPLYVYPPAQRGTPPGLQFMPAYVPAGPSNPRLDRALWAGSPRQSGVTWWLAIGLLVAGLLLALGLSAAYYVLNETRTNLVAVDYDATAIFKLTATKQAILDANGLPGVDGLPALVPTIPPTNTPRPE